MSDPISGFDPAPQPTEEPLAQSSALAAHSDSADASSPFNGFDLLYLVGFYFVSALGLTLLVATAAFVLFGVTPSDLEDSAAARGAVAIVTQFLLSAVTLAFLYALVRARTSAPFWPSVGWRAFRGTDGLLPLLAQYVFAGFALAVIIGLAARFFEAPTTLPIEEMLQSRESVLLLMALGILVAPLVEETIFRGCIYPVLARSLGIPLGIVATGALFGAAHIQQLWGGWGQILLITFVGTVLTYIRARAGTVLASYCVHLGYNTLLFVGFYLATGGLRNFP